MQLSSLTGSRFHNLPVFFGLNGQRLEKIKASASDTEGK
jgi:hypothetical protein